MPTSNSTTSGWVLPPKWRLVGLRDGSAVLIGESHCVTISNSLTVRLLTDLSRGGFVGTDEPTLDKLAELERAGLAVRFGELSPAEACYWAGENVSSSAAIAALKRGVSIEGTDPVVRPLLLEALGTEGLRESIDGAVIITAVDDYLDLTLLSANASRVEDRKPRLLVRPFGTTVLIGPLLIPGKTACLECLNIALRENRWVERALRENGAELQSPFRVGLQSTSLAAVHLAVQEAKRWLVLGRSQLLGTICEMDSGDFRMRRHPVPRSRLCPSCGQIGIPDEETAWHPIVSGLTGFLRNPRDLTPDRHWPVRLCGIEFVAPLAAGGPSESIRPQWAVGRATRSKVARKRAIYEAVERRSCYWHGDEPCVRASFEEVADHAVDPESLLLFSARQYAEGQKRLAPETPIEWRAAKNLTGDRIRLVPAAFCYMGYPEEAEWSPGADSNGCAAGRSIEHAGLGGLCELIEREAAAIWWYGRIPRPALDIDSVRARRVRKAIEFLRSRGLQPAILDLTTDWEIPVYAAIVRSTEGLFAAFGCSPDPGRACWQALSELFQAVFSRAVAHGGKGVAADWKFFSGDRVALRKRPQNTSAGELLRICVDKAATIGIEAWFVDMSRSSDGPRTVRVIAPGVRPASPRFAPGRLYDVPQKLGWIGTPLREAALNPQTLPL